jgi:hypothetical protein
LQVAASMTSWTSTPSRASTPAGRAMLAGDRPESAQTRPIRAGATSRERSWVPGSRRPARSSRPCLPEGPPFDLGQATEDPVVQARLEGRGGAWLPDVTPLAHPFRVLDRAAPQTVNESRNAARASSLPPLAQASSPTTPS